VPEFLVEKPAAAEVILRTTIAVAGEAIILFFMLVAVLHRLRRWMDLTFPEAPVFYRSVLVVALVAAVLWMVPIVGWILALVAVAALTMRFFDGDVLAGFYVALALWATHVLANLLLLARIRDGR
jgi:hypothetical protein